MLDYIQATRDYLTSRGYQVQESGADGSLKATLKEGRHSWRIELVPENNRQLPSRSNLHLVREDSPGISHTWPIDHFAHIERYMNQEVQQAIAYSILDDPSATDDELKAALASVGNPARRGQVGYSGNRMDVAVLADVVVRLLERVKKLEGK